MEASLKFLLCLYFGVILKMHPAICGLDSLESGSGSGGGDAYGECEIPTDVPEIPRGSEGDVIKLIRCHVLCIEKVAF